MADGGGNFIDSVNMAERTYRVALIGLGRIAWLMEEDPLRVKPCTHAGAWLSHSGVELVAGCDVDAERRARFQARYPQARLYGDYRQMLAAESPDLVSIAAYATERAEMVEACAEAGVAGIWCEKAMATSLAESDRMAQVLARCGTSMVVSYMRRWDERCRAAKRMVAQGAIGRLESINVHFSGNLLHTGTHAFDLLRLFAGEALTVQGWLQQGGGRAEQSGYRYGGEVIEEDVGGFALIEFEQGVRAVVHAHDKRYFRFELELLGDSGMIRLGNTQAEWWTAQASSNFVGFKELKQVPFEVADGDAPAATAWRAASEDLIAAVASGQPVACGVADGRAALAIALAIHESHAKGGVAVNLDGVARDYRVPSR